MDDGATLPGNLADHADLKTFALPPGARLLLATDGLWSAPGAAPPDPAAPAADAAATLAQAALAAGGTDNVTLVLGGFPAQTQTP